MKKKWKYTVVSVNPHPEENGWGLVSVRPLFDTEQEAMEDAEYYARHLMQCSKELEIDPDFKMEDVWQKVDNGQLGAAHDVGYDPLSDARPPARWHRIRVVATYMEGEKE